MGTTPVYTLPYPEPANPPDGPAQIKALAERVEAVLTATVRVPPATIAPTMAVAAPVGWLFCDGASKLRADFAALADAMGIPAGQTSFNLPNLRGRVPAGLDAAQPEFDVLGEQGGVKEVGLTLPHLPKHKHGGGAHAHTVNEVNHGHSVGSPDHAHGFATGNLAADSGAGFWGSLNAWHETGRDIYTWPYGTGQPTQYPSVVANKTNLSINASVETIVEQGSDTPHPNLAPYVVVNYIIKT